MNDAEEYYNDAVKFYKSGYGDDYIRLNFAERKVSDDTIEEIIQRIRILREKEVLQRSLGYFGIALIFISFGAACYYYDLVPQSSRLKNRFFPYLGSVFGLGLIMKGLFDIIEPKYFRRKSKKKY